MRRRLLVTGMAACLCLSQTVSAEDELRDRRPYLEQNGTTIAGAYPVNVLDPAGNVIALQGELLDGNYNFANGVPRNGLPRAYLSTILATPGAAAARNPANTTLDLEQGITILGREGAGTVEIWLVAGAVGDITRNAGGTTSATFTAVLEQQNNLGAWVAVPNMNITFTFNTAGAHTQQLRRLATRDTRANANARNFRLRTTSVLVCRTAAGNAGRNNIVDFYTRTTTNETTHRERGFYVAVMASPSGFPDSREAIGLEDARSDNRLKLRDGTFALGRGVNIGQIELGVPTTSHVDLPAAALRVDTNAANVFYRDEHATAVAGIMVGRHDFWPEWAGVSPGARCYSTGFTAYTGTEEEKILRSARWLFDVPTVADVANASFGRPNFTDVATPDGNTPKALLFDWIVDRRNKIITVSAGNYGVSGAVPGPGEVGSGQSTTLINREQSISGGNGGYNVITVGALNWDFKNRAHFSSFGPTRNPNGRVKPDIMAPGLMISVPTVADLNADGSVNDYSTLFFGADDNIHLERDRSLGGYVNGTSFAAPHVAGAVATYLEYVRDFNAATHGDATDPRIVKAAIINTGDRTVKRREGTAWSQGTTPNVDWPININVPLDQQLGGGLLKIDQAMLQVRPNELNTSDALAVADKAILHKVSDTTSWDRQQIGRSSNNRSKVSYHFKGGLTRGQTLRSTLVWHRRITEADGNNAIDATDTYSYTDASLNDLDLLLWEAAPKGAGDSNGWNRYARSVSSVDNVECLSARIATSGEHVLQVFNHTNRDDRFGLVWLVTGNPAPAGGRIIASAKAMPESSGTETVAQLADVELNHAVFAKATFRSDQILTGLDDVFVMDTNCDFVYEPGVSYPIYFGPERRDNASDPNSDTDWFEAPSVSLMSLNGWRTVSSLPADPDGSLPPTLISDSTFRNEIRCGGRHEYNFVIDVDGDGMFTPDVDGIGYFVVEGSRLTTLWDTGLPRRAMFDPDGAGPQPGNLSYVGFVSGSAPATPQQWVAQPFELAQDSVLSRVTVFGFVNGAFDFRDMGVVIWLRSGEMAPTTAVASFTLPRPTPTDMNTPYSCDPGDPDYRWVLPIDDVELPAGQYYLTVYGGTPVNNVSRFAWLFNAPDGVTMIENGTHGAPFVGHPFYYRSNAFPSPGYFAAQLNPLVYSPDPSDPQGEVGDLYHGAFILEGSLLGGGATGCPNPGCDSGGTDADFDNNCVVNLTDLATLLANFGRASGASNATGDTDGDGDTDLTDLANLLARFGMNCQ